jgi:hypothetical protein
MHRASNDVWKPFSITIPLPMQKVCVELSVPPWSWSIFFFFAFNKIQEEKRFVPNNKNNKKQATNDN